MKKLLTALFVIISLAGAWYLYQTSNAKIIDPNFSDGAESGRQFIKYQKELQQKK